MNIWILLTSQSHIVEVDGGLDDLQFATNVEVLNTTAKVSDRRVGRVVSAKDFDSLLDLIRFIDVVHF